MDYSDQSCQTGFTTGQIARMHDQLNTYRGFKFPITKAKTTSHPFTQLKKYAEIGAGTVAGLVGGFFLGKGKGGAGPIEAP